MYPEIADDERAVARGRHEVASESVSALFRAHHVELVRLALLVTGDLALAEDVVQDAYERLQRSWHRIRRPQDGIAYARSVVLNGCRSAGRRQAVARRNASRLAAGAQWCPDAAASADDRSELAAALRMLSRRQREVIVLRYYCDLSVEQTALTLGIAPSAVRSTASRGLAVLAGLLKGAPR